MRGGQLDRERQAFQPPHQVDERAGDAGVDVEIRLVRPGAIDEQGDRRVHGDLGQRGAGGRQFEGA